MAIPGGGGVAVIINQAALAHVLGSPSGMTGQYMYRKAIQTQNAAKAFCPVKTGRLRSSITVNLRSHGASGVEFEVGTNVEYAIYVHDGRGPVRPVHARVLRWESDGEIIFRPYAGPAAAQPFLKRALESLTA